jgi:3D (Asp-Asp-Asp) domain-containing protein
MPFVVDEERQRRASPREYEHAPAALFYKTRGIFDDSPRRSGGATHRLWHAGCSVSRWNGGPMLRARRCVARGSKKPSQLGVSATFSLCFLALVTTACAVSLPGGAQRTVERELVVTASAYNSTVDQTDSDPTLTAHGVRLAPGMQIIAVSRDLEAMGLRAGTRVQIEGLPGVWAVADRMPKQRRRAIDVYMGLDVTRARAFGRREVTIRWPVGAD